MFSNAETKNAEASEKEIGVIRFTKKSCGPTFNSRQRFEIQNDIKATSDATTEILVVTAAFHFFSEFFHFRTRTRHDEVNTTRVIARVIVYPDMIMALPCSQFCPVYIIS